MPSTIGPLNTSLSDPAETRAIAPAGVSRKARSAFVLKEIPQANRLRIRRKRNSKPPKRDRRIETRPKRLRI